jgi:hypothetical protein
MADPLDRQNRPNGMTSLHGQLLLIMPPTKRPGAVSRPGAIPQFLFRDIHDSRPASNNNFLRRHLVLFSSTRSRAETAPEEHEHGDLSLAVTAESIELGWRASDRTDEPYASAEGSKSPARGIASQMTETRHPDSFGICGARGALRLEPNRLSQTPMTVGAR